MKANSVISEFNEKALQKFRAFLDNKYIDPKAFKPVQDALEALDAVMQKSGLSEQQMKGAKEFKNLLSACGNLDVMVACETTAGVTIIDVLSTLPFASSPDAEMLEVPTFKRLPSDFDKTRALSHMTPG